MVPLYLKKRWPLYIALIVFIIAKLPHLSYGFYWDECWVYAPAIFLMYANGPSLSPGAISTEYSRGHPLFFQAGCAAWMLVFGKSNFAMHTFALLVAVLLVIALYEIMLRLFNQSVAIISVLLLLFNKYFFAESSFVTTDVMITLLVLLSLYCYLVEQHVLTVLCLTMLFFTKESGMVAGVVLFFDVFARFVLKKLSLRQALVKAGSVVLPFLFVFIFFIAQKRIHGWYLYPGHTSIINLGIENTMYNIQRTLRAMFVAEKDYYFFGLLLLLSALAAWRQKKWTHLLFFPAAVLTWLSIYVFSFKDGVIYAYAALVPVAAFFLFKRLTFYKPLQLHFLKLAFAFCVAYVYFCCINFYEERYLIPVMFFISTVLTAVFCDFFIARSGKRLQPYILAAIVCIGCFTFMPQNMGSEVEVYDRMDVQQDVVKYFEKNEFYDKHIYCRSFFEQIHLKDPKTGFLHSDKAFKKIEEKVTNETDLAIFTSTERDNLYEQLRKDSAFFCVYRSTKGFEWVEVYQRDQTRPLNAGY